MELAAITLQQVMELFILILAGVILYKMHVIRSEQKGVLSAILIDFVVPCMVVGSFLGKTHDNMMELGKAFLYSLILCTIGIIISLCVSMIIHKKVRDVFRFACSFSNAAYMGFPLISALFGDTGIMFASAYITVFNILLWTVGYMFFANIKSPRQILLAIAKCPPIIGVGIGLILYIGNIRIPEFLADPINMAGAMNTPLSMIITGITVAETDVRCILKDKNLWIAVLVRLILIPCICTAVFVLFHFSGIPAVVCLILEACPAAAITTMLAFQYGKDQQYAAGLVVVSTLLSIVSLPMYAVIIQWCGVFV